jgi:hypothetical protein
VTLNRVKEKYYNYMDAFWSIACINLAKPVLDRTGFFLYNIYIQTHYWKVLNDSQQCSS